MKQEALQRLRQWACRWMPRRSFAQVGVTRPAVVVANVRYPLKHTPRLPGR